MDDSGTANKEADRALLRVREKLLGLEEGTLLSERGQVSYLVLSATNEELLAQMYHGWQPWM
jgi:ataxia telangiectasia mutated family protein